MSIRGGAAIVPLVLPSASISLCFLSSPTSSFEFFLMSHVPSASTSSSSFQSIFDAALKAYEKKTKKDLLAHLLAAVAAQLQACNSPGDILAVLRRASFRTKSRSLINQ